MLPTLDLSELRGTILAVPVANPVGFAANTRVIIEDDIDFGNVNRVFPGRRAQAAFGSGDADATDRSLAERIADALTTTLLERADFALDMHCHQEGIGLVKCIQGRELSGRSAEWAPKMCKAWNLGIIHEYTCRETRSLGRLRSAGSPPAWPRSGPARAPLPLSSVTSHNAGPKASVTCFVCSRCCREPTFMERQLFFGHGPHIRPSNGGYLVSELDPTSLFENGRFGVPVERGQLLGRIFDPYRLELIEELRSPCDGVLYMARRSGPVEISSHAYAVADTADGRWG